MAGNCDVIVLKSRKTFISSVWSALSCTSKTVKDNSLSSSSVSSSKKSRLPVKDVIKLLRMDVYFFLFMFGYAIALVPTTQLVQDKICLNQLKLSSEVCVNLQNAGSDLEYARNIVLAGATSIKNYQTILATLPGIVQSLFIGYYIDTFPAHIRYLLPLPCLGLFFQHVTLIMQCVYFETDPLHSIWSYLLFGLGGGKSIAFACAFTYIARKTSPKFRVIRFAFLDLFGLTAMPSATAVGAKILAMNPFFRFESRNYIGVYVTGALLMIFNMIWSVVLINDCGDELEPLSTHEINPLNDINQNDKDNIDIEFESNRDTQTQKRQKARSSFLSIVNLNNVKQTFITCLKPRKNQGRAQLIHICFAATVIMINFYSESNFGFQYTQAAFSWNFQYYSNMYAALTVTMGLGSLIGALVLKQMCNFSDTALSIIGSLSHLISNIFKGIMEPWAYITGSLVYTFGGLVLASSRSIITTIIEPYEIAQIFAIISCMQASTPMISSIFCAEIFKATIQRLSSFTYHALAIILIYPLIVFLWIDLIQKRQKRIEYEKKANVKP